MDWIRRALELQRLRVQITGGMEQVTQGQTGRLEIKKIKAEGRKRLANYPLRPLR